MFTKLCTSLKNGLHVLRFIIILCIVILPQLFFQVSWRKLGPNYLLTIGEMVFSFNDKIDIQHKRDWQGVNHWNLVIKRVAPDDAGLYECQVSSAQPLVYYVQLNVLGNGFSTKKLIHCTYTYILTVKGIVVIKWGQ